MDYNPSVIEQMQKSIGTLNDDYTSLSKSYEELRETWLTTTIELSEVKSDIRVVKNDIQWIHWMVAAVFIAIVTSVVIGSLNYRLTKKNNGNNKN